MPPPQKKIKAAGLKLLRQLLLKAPPALARRLAAAGCLAVCASCLERFGRAELPCATEATWLLLALEK